MPRATVLQLNETQRTALIAARDHHAKPYIREQAAALLRIADGASIRRVARSGVLKPRRQETVKLWLDRFVAGGITHLLVRQGRGRKPAFSPSARRHRGS